MDGWVPAPMAVQAQGLAHFFSGGLVLQLEPTCHVCTHVGEPDRMTIEGLSRHFSARRYPLTSIMNMAVHFKPVVRVFFTVNCEPRVTCMQKRILVTTDFEQKKREPRTKLFFKTKLMITHTCSMVMEATRSFSGVQLQL